MLTLSELKHVYQKSEQKDNQKYKSHFLGDEETPRYAAPMPPPSGSATLKEYRVCAPAGAKVPLLSGVKASYIVCVCVCVASLGHGYNL